MSRQLSSFVAALVVLVGFPAHRPAVAQEQLTILHWNDFHAQNLPLHLDDADTTSPWVGGAAVFKAYLDSLRAERAHTLALHAGDEFQGSPISTVTRGRSQIVLLNILRPDAFELGNHEFDYGRDNLQQCIREATFPVLAANLLDSLSREPFAQPVLIHEVGKVRVGVIGVITEDLAGLSIPDHVRGLRVEPVVPIVRRYVEQLEDQVDLIIVLSHIGFRADSLLALQVPEVDVIVGGHRHLILQKPREVNGVIIVQAGSRGRYLGVLDLWVDPETDSVVRHEGRLLITRVDSVTPDARVQAVVDSLEAAARSELDQIIGTLARPWIRGNRRSESNIGNWQADVMRAYTGADVAFQNSGGIRKGMAAGPIRVRDIWEINPFSNYFLTFTVTGAELRQILEKQVGSPKEFLQVSGLRYRYDPSHPEGSRIVSVKIGGRELREDATYTVATNNYVSSHFEEFFGFPRGDRRVRIFPKLDRDVFVEAVKKAGVIDSRIEGRVLPVDAQKGKMSAPR